MANVSFNPGLTTSPQSTILKDSQGLMQGITQDDWNSRAFLMSAVVGSGVTQPVWGGMAAGLTTNGLGSGSSSNGGNKPVFAVPTTATGVQGFTIFDQGINMIQVPGNSVPISTAGMDIPIYLIGSRARVPVPVDSGSVSGLESAALDAALYWNPVTNALSTTATNNILLTGVKILSLHDNSKAISYNSSTGAVTWLESQTLALILL